jgi:hypothetical protein
MFGVALALILACTPTALLDFAIPKWKADKNMRIEDAYKWTYQATRGGEHAVPDRESAGKWLEREWQSLGEESTDKTGWVPLCPDGSIGRFDLRLFKARGGRADDVLDAFLASAVEYRSEPKTFIDAWIELGKRLRQRTAGKLTHKEWLRLDGEMRKNDYPAIHHSKTYNEAYRPAYRVMTLRQAEKLIH